MQTHFIRNPSFMSWKYLLKTFQCPKMALTLLYLVIFHQCMSLKQIIFFFYYSGFWFRLPSCFLSSPDGKEISTALATAWLMIGRGTIPFVYRLPRLESAPWRWFAPMTRWGSLAFWVPVHLPCGMSTSSCPHHWTEKSAPTSKPSLTVLVQN